MSTTALVLYQFRPAYDVLAYLALAGAPLTKCQVENIAYPTLQACNSEPLPCLRRGGEFIPQSEIFTFLKREFADLDAGLSLELKAESHAFATLLLVELQFCLDVIRYADEEHWWRVTYVELVKCLPAPFGRLVARKLRRDALQKLPGIASGSQAMRMAKTRARAAYLALANRLGDSKWFLNTPGASTVDALLFGHLCQARFEPVLGALLREDEDLAVLETHYLHMLNRVRQSRFFSTSKSSFPGPELEMVALPPTRFDREEAAAQRAAAAGGGSNRGASAGEEDVFNASSGGDRAGLLQAGAFALGTLFAYLAWNELLVVRGADEDDME